MYKSTKHIKNDEIKEKMVVELLLCHRACIITLDRFFFLLEAGVLEEAILPHLRLIGDLRAAGERVDFIPIYAQKNGAALRSGQKAGACVCQGMCVRNCPCKLLNMPCHPSRCRCDFTCCKNTEAASTAARAKRKSKQKYGGKRGRGRKKKSARR